MMEPQGFGDFFGRTARADGNAGAAAAATTTAGTGKYKWLPEDIAALIASITAGAGAVLSGASAVIDSTGNNKAAMQLAGAQNVSLQGTRNNNALFWVLGGGALLLVLLVLVLRK